MKPVLIKNAKIVDPRSPLNGKTTDLLISEGTISKSGKGLKADDAEVISIPNLHLSPGWFDMRVNIPDPGHEYKEDILSAAGAAAEGGFTAMACTATAEPARDTKAAIEYVINRSRSLPVKIYPMGALSAGHQGKDIAEMYDMFRAGAVAFTDDKNPVRDTGLLGRALFYASRFEGLVISFPYDNALSPGGKVNEGVAGTKLGLKGIPAISEELAVSRDITLARYSNSKIHLATLSAAGSVDLIKEAREEKLQITAEVSAHHLLLTDESLEHFDTNFKLLPPLRTEHDRQALLNGLAEDTIDVICSDHTPEDIEEKLKEFDLAAYGATGLETMFSVARTATSSLLPLEKLIEKISINPCRILNIPLPGIFEGEPVNITLFDPDAKVNFTRESLVSLSKNSPVTGMELKGVPLGIITAQGLHLTKHTEALAAGKA